MSGADNGDTDQRFEVIKPPDTLSKRVKIGGPNAVKLDGLADSDTSFIDNVAANYLAYFKEDLKVLSAAFAKLKDAPGDSEIREEVFTAAHDIKGQAGSFGYDLITDMANSLCRFLEKLSTLEKKHLEVVSFHVEAMKIAEAKEMKGNGGPAGQKLLAGLKGVVEKVEGT